MGVALAFGALRARGPSGDPAGSGQQSRSPAADSVGKLDGLGASSQRLLGVAVASLPEAVSQANPAIRLPADSAVGAVSEVVLAYLGTRPGRFDYVHTPKHGSWLNLVECVFSKMATTFLRHIRGIPSMS
jgi:hypothetical protein